ncbi:Hypothetical protein SCF082_LOCUS50178, partial [Durusdinium trenchii]
FIPRIIGKGGETIRAVREKYEVNIKILEEDGEKSAEKGEKGAEKGSASGPRTIRIFGNSAESIAAARAEVEYVEEAMPVDEDQYQWLSGSKGMRSIWTFKEAAGLVYTRLEYESQQLLLCGNRSAVEDAIALFETHFMYCPVFRQMDEELENIFAELESYGDYDARWESWHEEPKSKSRRDADGKGEAKAEGKGSHNGNGRWADSRETKDVSDARGGPGGRWDKRKAERG